VSDVTDAIKHGDDEVTELVHLEASKLAAVGSPANGTPWLLVKAAKGDEPKSTTRDFDGDGEAGDDDAATADAFEENAKRVKQGKEPAKKEDGDASKSDSSEADEIEEQMTGSAAKGLDEGAYCGDPECSACQKAGALPDGTHRLNAVAKAKLKAADRKKMPAGSFAYVDPKGGKHLPIHDKDHVSAAMGRFGQQDFSDAEDPDDAKAKAAGTIKAAAGKFGMKIDDDSDVAQAAKKEEAQKGDSQDALQGTKAPEVAGHLDGSQSGIAGSATPGLKDLPSTVPPGHAASSRPGMTAQLAGGETPYEIPAEQHIGVGNSQPQLAAKAMVAASLIQAMEQVAEQREAAKAGGFLQVPGPSADQAAAPGSMPWESYDAAKLDQVASVLASCCNAIDAITTREQIEALGGDAGDQCDAWDLQDASSALEYAMGVVARLAYSEQAEAQKSEDDPHYQAVEKAYRRLRSSDEKALRGAHAALSNVLAEHDRAGSAAADAGQDDSSEGDKIQMELTKSELAEAIVAGAQEVLKAQREQDEQTAKEQRKAAKKAAKAEAKKNANNGGDITAQQLKDGVGSEQDADDVGCVQGAVDSKYVNKSEGEQSQGDEGTAVLKAMQDQLKAATEQLGQLGEQVQKIAKRPRSGGPVLDGQARGAFPAAESRMSEVTKGDEDESTQLIKSLEAEFQAAKEKGDPIAISDLGNRLTHARLMQAHEQGRI